MGAPATHGAAHLALSPALPLRGPDEGGPHKFEEKHTEFRTMVISLLFFSKSSHSSY